MSRNRLRFVINDHKLNINAEADAVFIGSTLNAMFEQEEYPTETEIMLYYVACTRAKKLLCNARYLGRETYEIGEFINLMEKSEGVKDKKANDISLKKTNEKIASKRINLEQFI